MAEYSVLQTLHADASFARARSSAARLCDVNNIRGHVHYLELLSKIDTIQFLYGVVKEICTVVSEGSPIPKCPQWSDLFDYIRLMNT